MLRSRLFGALVAAVALLPLATALPGGTVMAAPAVIPSNGLTIPEHVYAPYYTSTSATDTTFAASGVKYFTYAFLQTASSGDPCTVVWNGSSSSPVAATGNIATKIALIRANGGDVIPSFGGASADTYPFTELSDRCTDLNAIATEFERVITTLNVTRIDLDIEEDSLRNPAGLDRRNKAIKLVEDWAAANSRVVQFQYTLPTNVAGLDAGLAGYSYTNGENVLQNAIANNARIDLVDLMTFDFYDAQSDAFAAGTGPAHNMGQDTVTALTHLHNTLHSLYPSKTDAQLWAMQGFCEMVGRDDYGAAETYHVSDAVANMAWAKSIGLGLITFWSYTRDSANRDTGFPIWSYSQVWDPYTGWDTGTALTSSSNPSVHGQAVTYSATVTATDPGLPTPTGSMQFAVDGINVGSAVSVDGSGTAVSAPIADMTTGVHSITAVYSGDVTLHTSTSPVLTEVVGKASTTKVVSSDPNPVVYGQPVTFKTTISALAPGAGVPTGTAQFRLDGADLGSPVTLDGTGSASSLAVSNLSNVAHDVTVHYSGDANFCPATCTGITQVVSLAPPTAVVTSTSNPAPFGAPVSWTATITGASGTPTGTVQFLLDGVDLNAPVALDGSGQAVAGPVSDLPHPWPASGSHTVQVFYSGDSHYAASVSPLLTQVVNYCGACVPTVEVTSNHSPSSVHGQSVTFTVTVTGDMGYPTGTVQLSLDGAPLGNPINLYYWASSSQFPAYTTLTTGTHTITASYSGDADFAPVAISAPLTQIVNKSSSTTSLASNHNPATTGQSVTITATVARVSPGAGTPTGNLQWAVDGTASGSPVALDGTGKSTLTQVFPDGCHVVTAAYAGDDNFNVSTSTAFKQTVAGVTCTNTALTSNHNPSTHAQGVTYTATVTSTPSAGIPAGTVQFAVDGTNAGSPVALDGTGKANSDVLTNLTTGTHAITATYVGSDTYAASTSAALSQVVGMAATSTTLVSDGNPSAHAQAVTFSATVASDAGIPTGTVQFAVDGSNVGSPVALDGTGKVSSSPITNLATGAHDVTAVYSGDTDFATSASTTLNQGVGVAATTTTMVSDHNPAIHNQAVTYTASVASSAGIPTGTVQFVVDGSNLGLPVAVDGTGKASSDPIPSLSTGAHTVAAVYSGDTDYATSTSDTLSQSVGVASTTTVVVGDVDPAAYGQPVTFTATVSSDAGMPTGTIQFTLDGVDVGAPVALDGTGKASTAPIGYMDMGPCAVGAVYSGSDDFATSTGKVTSNVVKADSGVAISSNHNSATHGQAVTFTATVTVTAPGSGTPTGTVQFSLDGVAYGSPVALDDTGNAVAAPTITLTAGSHSVSAVYSGDDEYNGATSLAFIQGVDTAASVTTITTNHSPAKFGQSVRFTATVTSAAGVPVGTVQFVADGVNIGAPVALSSTGKATSAAFSALVVGRHAIAAVYSGGGEFSTSASTALTQVVRRASTATSVKSSPNPSRFGRSLTLTATVRVKTPGAGTPTGTVTFYVDGMRVGSAVALSSGRASMVMSFILAKGHHTIAAVYSGATGFAASTSPKYIHVVRK